MTDINGDLFERRLLGRLFLLCVALTLCVVTRGQTASSQAIERRLTLPRPFVGPADSLLAIVERKAGIVVAYSSRIVPRGDVRMPQGRHSVGQCLEAVFGRYNVRYVNQGEKIVVASDSVRMRTVSGFCRDGMTGEVLMGAYVVDTLLRRVAVTNEYGFFSISVPTGRVPLRLSYVGYTPAVRTVELRTDTMIGDVRLRQHVLLPAVDVRATDGGLGEAGRMGVTSLPMEQVRAMPTLMGEADLTRALQQTPGVQSGGEGFGGMSVRGGSQDQNMVYLDDAPLYNPNHMLGFFSVFNSEAISNARLLKSGFPARYGGRMSSVLDVKTLDGNMDHFEGDANVGLVASSLMVQGPFARGKSSYMFSARRTYFDLIAYLLQKDDSRYSYMFYDFHGKFNWTLPNRDRLRLSLFFSRDRLNNDTNMEDVAIDYGNDETRLLSTSDEAQSSWGTILGSLRWSHAFSPNVFANVTVWYSQYRFRNSQRYRVGVNAARGFLGNRYLNGIHDAGARADVSVYPTLDFLGQIRLGAWATYRLYQPLMTIAAQTDEDQYATTAPMRSGVDIERYEFHAYVEDHQHWGPMTATAGLHLTAVGRSEDSPYIVAEPRLMAGWEAGRDVSVKLGYSLTTQFVYQMRIMNVATPADFWMPVPKGMGPQKTHQLSVEANWRILPDVTLTVEAYNKWLPRQVTYSDISPYEVMSGNDWDALGAPGRGYARGLEIFAHRRKGRLSGWAGYTLSKARSRFERVNGGGSVPSDNDRLHAVQIFATFDMRPGVDISASWSYGTGVPLSLPTQHYSVAGSNATFAVPAQRNAMRMPANHQLNLGVNIKFGDDHVGSLLSFGVYNAYGRQNPMFVYWKATGDAERPSYSLKKFSLVGFPWPYVKYSIHF